MTMTVVKLFFWATYALALANILVTVGWKRKEISMTEACFKFPFKYGLFWCFTRPQLYFDEKHAKAARLLAIDCMLAILYTVLLTVSSGRA